MATNFAARLTVVLALTCGTSVAACGKSTYIVVGVSDFNADVIARVAWTEGTRDVLLRANDDGAVVVLSQSPRDPKLTVLDPASCKVLGQIALATQTNWFGIGNELGPGQVYNGPMVLDDNAKGIEPAEFDLLPEDVRCRRGVGGHHGLQ